MQIGKGVRIKRLPPIPLNNCKDKGRKGIKK